MLQNNVRGWKRKFTRLKTLKNRKNTVGVSFLNRGVFTSLGGVEISLIIEINR